jgi:beta-1,4-galactosyltransferase 1
MYSNIIAIPFRERDQHLEYFIKNTVPLLEQHLPNTKVVVVEQNKGKLFNRGALLNIAFKEYENKTKYFFTHDVDINPTKKCIEELYSRDVDEKDILGIYTSICDTLGGIIKMQNITIHSINGFPNDIWGWGAEDKALQNRSNYFGIKKLTNLTNNKEHPEYLIRFNDIDDRISKNNSINLQKYDSNFNKFTNEQKYNSIMSSGLNNLEYTILERKMIHNIVELIKVEI